MLVVLMIVPIAKLSFSNSSQNYEICLPSIHQECPTSLGPSIGSNVLPSSPVFPKSAACIDDEHYMNYVLEKADSTLNDLHSFTFTQFQSIVFQVLFALYVSQSCFKFMHNDLHFKEAPSPPSWNRSDCQNILLIHPSSRSEDLQAIRFRDEQNVWEIKV